MIAFSSLERSCHTIANIPSRPLLLQQILVDPILPHFIRHASTPYHRGKDHAGTDAVDANVFRTMLRGHGSGHLNDCTLGCGV